MYRISRYVVILATICNIALSLFPSLTEAAAITLKQRSQALVDLIAPLGDRFPQDKPYIPRDVPPYQLPFRAPSNKTLQEMREHNARRFPGEIFPDGYDTQDPAPVYTASAKTLWTSPKALEIDAEHEPRVWHQLLKPGQPRPKGRLLLNMIVKDEREHLSRTLPLWAKIIDYWIIGVDDKNTDDSIEIIKKHLGHLPGEICVVHFDGIGPTWNQIVQLGILHFPGATHGILADADYTPVHSTFNREELDIRTSIQLFRVMNEARTSDRQIDWIYRNIPGARVLRRCHHAIEVPPQPQQDVNEFHKETPGLTLTDREGGYGDRAGGKQLKYIKWLESDLLEWPNDGHTLYYLAHSHYDFYELNPKKENLHHVHSAIKHFEHRVNITIGTPEARYFSLIKIAEMSHTWLSSPAKADETYRRAVRMDPYRMDAMFYLAQLKWQQPTATGNGKQADEISGILDAISILQPFISMPTPARSWFQWYELYTCIARVTLARMLYKLPHANTTDEILSATLRALDGAVCNGRDGIAKSELTRVLSDRRVNRADALSRGFTLEDLDRAEKTNQPLRNASPVNSSPSAAAAAAKKPKQSNSNRKGKGKTKKDQKRNDDDEDAEQEDLPSRRKKKKEKTTKTKQRQSQTDSDDHDDEEEERDSPSKRKKSKEPSKPTDSNSSHSNRTPDSVASAAPVEIKRPAPPKPSAAYIAPIKAILDFEEDQGPQIFLATQRADGVAPYKFADKEDDWMRAYDRWTWKKTDMRLLIARYDALTCRQYRKVTTPYLNILKTYSLLLSAQPAERREKWEKLLETLRTTCR